MTSIVTKQIYSNESTSMTRRYDYIASNQRSGNGEESIVDSVADQEHKKTASTCDANRYCGLIRIWRRIECRHQPSEPA